MKDRQLESHIDYSSLVGLLGERNRPSGGIKTVHEVIVNARIAATDKVLEIGSNTGFTTVQIARITGAEVTGIDINEASIRAANEYAAEHSVEERVNFLNASATDIPFPDNSFDVVWASNVTSFLQDKEKAISEYLRVLKPNGYLVFVPIYYVDSPPAEIIRKVSMAIGSTVHPYKKSDWLDMINGVARKQPGSLDLVYESDMRYEDRAEALDRYIEGQLVKLQGKVTELDMAHIRSLYEDQIRLFNENLKFAGYSTLLFQKNGVREEQELFLTYRP